MQPPPSLPPPPVVRQSHRRPRRHAAKIALPGPLSPPLPLPLFVDCCLSAAAIATVVAAANAAPVLISTPSFNDPGIVALSSLSSMASRCDSMTRQRQCGRCRHCLWMLPWLSSILNLPSSFSLAGCRVSFVPPPPPSVLAASRSADASRRTAASASIRHSFVQATPPLVIPHRSPRLVVALPIVGPPFALSMCYHIPMRRHLPFAQSVFAWLLVALQPLDAPSGCHVASRCTNLSFALAGCRNNSRRTAYASRPAAAT